MDLWNSTSMIGRPTVTVEVALDEGTNNLVRSPHSQKLSVAFATGLRQVIRAQHGRLNEHDHPEMQIVPLLHLRRSS